MKKYGVLERNMLLRPEVKNFMELEILQLPIFKSINFVLYRTNLLPDMLIFSAGPRKKTLKKLIAQELAAESTLGLRTLE